MNCSDARMRSTNEPTSSGCPTNAARTTSAITGWSASRSGRMTTPSARGGDGNWALSGARVPGAVGPRLRAVAAELHRAPARRSVLGVVVKRPAAVVVPARLEPLPGPVLHRCEGDGDDP